MDNLFVYCLACFMSFFVGLGFAGGFDEPVVKSETPLSPQIELTTDGKTVDTLYVYKIEK